MDSDRLVLRDYPVMIWLFGVAIGWLAYAIYQDGGLVLAIMLGLLAGLCLLLPEALTVTADKNSGFLTLRYGLIFTRSQKQVALHTIRIARVGRVSMRAMAGATNPPYRYRVEIVQLDGTVVPWHEYYGQDPARKFRQAERLNEFLGLGLRQVQASTR